MQTTKRPYELLIRWDQSGALAGAHIQYRYVVEDGGHVVGETVKGAEPLIIGEFPLNDLLSQVQADALAECERLRADLAAATARLAEVQASREA